MYDCRTYETINHYPKDTTATGWDYIGLVDAYFKDKDQVMADVMRLADDTRCLLIMDADRTDLDVWWYLHPSLRVDGWQLTRCDYDGPVCHDNIGFNPHELSHALPDHIECWFWAA